MHGLFSSKRNRKTTFSKEVIKVVAHCQDLAQFDATVTDAQIQSLLNTDQYTQIETKKKKKRKNKKRKATSTPVINVESIQNLL